MDSFGSVRYYSVLGGVRLLWGGFGRRETYGCAPSLDKFVHVRAMIQQDTDYLKVGVFRRDRSMQGCAFIADEVHVCSSLAQHAHSIYLLFRMISLLVKVKYGLNK